MALTAGELEILVNVNTQEIERLKAQLTGVTQQTKKTQMGFAKMAASFFTAQTAINLFNRGLQAGKKYMMDSINNAKDLGEETSKFGVVFRGVTQEAKKMRDDLVDAYGMSRLEATKTLASFGDFLVPMGLARDQAADLSGKFTKLAVDIGSFNNLPTADVIEKIKSALAGMSRPLQSVGVDVSETTLKQMAMAKGIEIVGGKLDRQTRAQLIYEKILQDSADAHGDFIRTSDQLANRLKILESVQQDISSTIGSTLLPIVNKVAGSFLDGAKSVRDWLSEEKNLTKVFKTIKSVASIFYILGKAIQLNFKIMKDFLITPWIIAGKVIWEFLKPINQVITGMKKAADNIKKFLKPALETIGNLFKKAKDKASEFAESVGIDFKAKLPKNVTAGLNTLQKEIMKTGKSYVTFTKGIKKGIEEVNALELDLEGVGGADLTGGDIGAGKETGPKDKKVAIQIQFDVDMFKDSANSISNILGDVTNTATSSFQNAFNTISDIVTNTTQKIQELLSSGFKEGAAKAINTFRQIAAVIQAVGETAKTIISGITEVMDKEFEARLEKLEEQHDTEIEAIDEKLAREIELIENNGMTKQEALQNDIMNLEQALAIETDIEKRANLEKELSAKQKELQILKAQEIATKKKKDSDKKYAKEKYKLEVEQFNTKKAMDIIQATISYALGLVSLWANVWSLGPIAGAIMGGIMSGLLTGIFATQVSLIASQQPPPPPKFARGTMSAPGGMSLIGEEGAELMNVPGGSQIFDAKTTNEMLNPNFTIRNELFISEEQMALATSNSNKDNLRYENARR